MKRQRAQFLQGRRSASPIGPARRLSRLTAQRLALHRPKASRNRLWAQIGGSFERAFFQLSIVGSRLDPVEITALLGIQPSRSYKKGETTRSGSQYRKTGLWMLECRELRLSDRRRGQRQFERWVSSLPDSHSAWRAIHRRFCAKVALIVYSHSMNGEFLVTPTALRELAKRGLALMVDAYFSFDER